MKRQVLAMHGGTSFDRYEEYIDFLKTRELTIQKLLQPDDWKAALAQELGDEYEVLLPKMPNPANAKYAEWSIWFERCASLLRDDVVLIGHSLGGIFMAKYLSEHTFPKKIKATILVGSPFSDTSTVESLKDFALPTSLKGFETQGGQIYLVHSKDDPVVPFDQTALYTNVLPNAHLMAFDTRGHFNQTTFPELIELIRSL